MANEQNLRPGEHKLTVEEQKRGGIKSGEVRRYKRDLRKVMEMLLEKEYTDKQSGTTKSGAELIAFKQFQKAIEGDTKAFEVVRDTAGQKPVEKVEQMNVDADYQDAIEELKAYFNGTSEKSTDPGN